jgi:hypothetical protein
MRRVMPESVIPVTVLLASHLPVSGRGVEALVSQVFLEQSETISRVIQFHRVNREGVPQSVRAHPVHSASLRVCQPRQACSVSTLSYYLPDAMAVDAKDQPFPLTGDKPAMANIVLEHLQCLAVQWQSPHATVLLLLNQGFLHPFAALGTEGMASAQSSAALRTRQPYSGLEVLNSDCALGEVNVICCQAQRFTDTAAQMKEKADEQAVA